MNIKSQVCGSSGYWGSEVRVSRSERSSTVRAELHWIRDYMGERVCKGLALEEMHARWVNTKAAPREQTAMDRHEKLREAGINGINEARRSARCESAAFPPAFVEECLLDWHFCV